MNLVKFSIDSLRRTRPAPQRSVVIGDKEYPTTEIGGKLWLAENLDLPWDGLKVGIAKTEEHCPKAWYYDNDQATNGWNGRRLGLYYNYYAVEYMKEHASELFPGWHVASSSEWQELKVANMTFLNDPEDGRTALSQENLDWAPDWHGTNELKFNLKPNGEVYGGENFRHYQFQQWHRNIGAECWMWTSTAPISYDEILPDYAGGRYDTQDLYVLYFPLEYEYNMFFGHCVRLVHDY